MKMYRAILMIKLFLSIVLFFHVRANGQLQGTEDTQLEILGSGINPVAADSIILTFFATVKNRGSHSVVAGLRPERCCQHIAENDTDCESMALHTGLRNLVRPGQVRNLTLYFTNYYLHNRVGDCTVKVKWRQPGKTINWKKLQIHFDTQLPLLNFFQRIFSRLMYNYQECDSVDEERNGCKPVNCILKYLGHRSFFNQTQRRCRSTPKCLSPKTESERPPIVALSPLTNKCKNIKEIKFTQDILKLEDMIELSVLSYSKYPININCVHGHRSEENGSPQSCICDSGWMSKPFPAESFNPERDIYYMCDQLRDGTAGYARTQMASTPQLLALLILIILLLLMFCYCYLSYIIRRVKARKKINKLTEELVASSSSSSKLSTISVVSEAKSKASSKRSTPVSGRSLVSKSPAKSKLVEFSDLAREEHTTKPAESPQNIKEMYQKTQPLYLRFPENFQLKPMCRPRSPSPSPICSSSSSESVVNREWSIPDTSEIPSCHGHHIDRNLYSDSELPPLAASCSMDSFPRRVCSVSKSCTCICCKNYEALQPLISVKVQSLDPNKNTIVTVRKFLSSETCMSERVKFPGPSPKCIGEFTQQKWSLELDKFKGILGGGAPSEVDSQDSLRSGQEFWDKMADVLKQNPSFPTELSESLNNI